MNFEFKGVVLRCYEIDGEPWFLAKDVAKILGYKNDRDAIRVHTSEDDRKRLNYKACRDSRQAELWSGNDFSDKVLINESGLYCMIFGSQMESARGFKIWVTKEVLPAIRKTGGYIMGQEELSEDDQSKLAGKVKRLSAKVEQLRIKEAKLQKRRHELIADNKALKEDKKALKQKNKKLARTIDILNQDADDSFMILTRLTEDLKSALYKLDIASGREVPVDNVVRSYKIDMTTGFVM